MILFSEVLEHLKFGELSQLSIGGAQAGSISEDQYPKLITYINLALIELYKKFPIKMNTLDLELYADIQEYLLKVDFATSSASAEPVKYILDTGNIFTGGVLKVDSVANLAGDPIPVNQLNNESSIFTPFFNTLRIQTDIITPTLDLTDEIYTITYRQKPVGLDRSTVEGITELPIDDTFLEPLLSYIAHRAHLGQPKPDPAISSSYYSKYLAACRNVTELGLLDTLESINEKADINGWV